MKTLYVTDLDGTLLRTDDTVSPFTINTVNGLVDKGMLFTYATARSLVSASVVTRGLSALLFIMQRQGFPCIPCFSLLRRALLSYPFCRASGYTHLYILSRKESKGSVGCQGRKMKAVLII